MIGDVEIEFRKKQDLRAWEIVCNGTVEEREQFQDGLQRKFEEESVTDEKKPNKDY